MLTNRRNQIVLLCLLAALFFGFAVARFGQTAGQDEILYYVRLGSDLYQHGFDHGDQLVAYSPHLYGLAIWASHAVFGPGLAAARTPGVLATFLALVLACLWGRARAENRAAGTIWAFALLALGCSLPLAVQGSVIVDIDNAFLAPLVFLQCWALDLLVERRDGRSWVGFALATALALWGRLTTPAILLPVFLCYAWVRGNRRLAAGALASFAVGWLVFLLTWGGYCAATGVDFAAPFRYLRTSLFFATVGSRGASLRKVVFTGVYLWLWLGGGVVVLLAMLLWRRLREWWRLRQWRREDLFLGAGFYLLAGYTVVGGALFGFPKYHCPAVPLLLAGGIPLLARWQGSARRSSLAFLVGLAVLAFLVQVLLIGDPILGFRHDMRLALVTPEIPLRPVLIRLALSLGMGGLLLALPFVVARWRRLAAVPMVCAAAFGMNLGLLSRQNLGGYQTGYNYGDPGDTRRVAEWLRPQLATDSLVMVPGEVLYLLDRPHNPYLEDAQWKNAENLVHALELPRMKAAGISIVTNDASQYLTLTANPKVRAVLDRDYTEHRLGNYVLFVRNDSPKEPTVP
jgi:hypothetical protein